MVGDRRKDFGLPETRRWRVALSAAISIAATIIVFMVINDLIERIPLVGREYAHLIQTDDADDD
jgi:hypothetical protein